MHIEKDRFGEEIVLYDSQAEQLEAVRNWLDGNLGALTCEEVLLFRSCEEDPNNVRWEAEHAGVKAEEVDVLDINGLVFIFDLGHTFEEGMQILLHKIGPHPITPLTLWQLENQLTAKH